MSSPGVISKEIDRTFRVQSLESNTAGFAGVFRWGPVEELVFISSGEDELLSRFFRPDDKTATSFLSAANYLLYSQPLWVVRGCGGSALNAVPTLDTPQLIKNDTAYEGATLTGTEFIARYPGSLGNSLKVSVADSTGFSGWTYETEFTYAPAGTQVHIVVVDEDGTISGTAGTVLEKYELVDTTVGAKKYDGSTAYYVDVLKNQSNWILAGDTFTLSAGVYETSMQGGVDANDITTADMTSAFNKFANVEEVDIAFLFTGNVQSGVKGTAIDLCDTRQDCVAFHAPELADVYNNATAMTDVVEYRNTEVNKNTSYAFLVDNWKLVYDKYNDTNRWIPCDSDAAGLMARTFAQGQPWFSPAGFNRGQLKNVIKLAWNPNESNRKILYKANINSIVSFPGEGHILFGDRTMLNAPSAFDRINVRNLFIVIKKNISRAARYQLFELNDEITRSISRNAFDAYLRNVKAQRGIYDHKVQIDELNNPAVVIDANEMVGDIYIKPARSINTIKLNYIAVSTGVSFSESEA